MSAVTEYSQENKARPEAAAETRRWERESDGASEWETVVIIPENGNISNAIEKNRIIFDIVLTAQDVNGAHVRVFGALYGISIDTPYEFVNKIVDCFLMHTPRSRHNQPIARNQFSI